MSYQLPASIATPGYDSTGQFANNCIVFLSSSLILSLDPEASILILPFQVGSFRFQSAALQYKQSRNVSLYLRSSHSIDKRKIVMKKLPTIHFQEILIFTLISPVSTI